MRAKEIFEVDPAFREEPDLNQLDLVDQLLVFEDHIGRLEKDREERLGEDRDQRRRAERRNRDEFKVIKPESTPMFLLYDLTSFSLPSCFSFFCAT